MIQYIYTNKKGIYLMKIVIKDTETVRKDILKRGMNMRQFAERVDITQHYWSNIMNGKRYPAGRPHA